MNLFTITKYTPPPLPKSNNYNKILAYTLRRVSPLPKSGCQTNSMVMFLGYEAVTF